MATLKKLIIALEADPSGVSAGLVKAEGYIRAFSKSIGREMAAANIGNALAPGFQAANVSADAHGARVGRTFAQSLTATIHRHRALIPTLAGLVLSQGLASTGDIANATGGLERVVSTGHAAEKILENVAMLASFLLKPVPGLIAAVVGGAAAAIVKIWTHAKDEILKARQEFIKELNKMIDDIDQLGLQRKLQDVLVGKRSSGASVIKPGEFAGGLDSLLEEQRRLSAAIDFLDKQNRMKGGLLSLDPLWRKSRSELEHILDERKKKIDELKFQSASIQNAIMDVVPAKAGFGGQLPGTKTEESRPGSMKWLDQLEKELSQIEQTHSAMAKLGESIAPLLRPAADVWKDALSALSRHNVELVRTGRLYDATSLRLEEIAARAAELATHGLATGGLGVGPIAQTQAQIVAGQRGRLETGALGVLGFRYLAPPQQLPTPATLPASDRTLNQLRLRAVIATLEDGLSDLGTKLRNLAVSSVWAALRSIAGQLNPFSQVIEGINRAAAPLVPVMTRFANIVEHTLRPAFAAFAPVINSLLPLFDALFRVLSPILRALAPLFEALVPLLNALFPIIKAAAIAFTYVVQGASFLAGILFNIAGGIAVAIGGLIAAIGTIISKIPFLGGVGRDIRDFGNSIKNLGHSYEETANGLFETADQMAKARAEISGINLDGTQTALDALTTSAYAAAGSLLNIPTGYKVELARFAATTPITPTPTTTAGASASLGVGASGVGPSFNFSPGSVVISADGQTVSDLVDNLIDELRRRARAQLGDPTRWSEVQV